MDAWIDLLRKGMQEEIGNPLSEVVVMTGEKFRNDHDNNISWEYEVYWTVDEIKEKLDNCDIKAESDRPLTFTRNRGNCSYPSDCPYKDGCFRGLTPKDLLGNGFKEREPHHVREKEYWKNIEKDLEGERLNGEDMEREERERKVFPKFD
jgi:hypothetical protein